MKKTIYQSVISSMGMKGIIGDGISGKLGHCSMISRSPIEPGGDWIVKKIITPFLYVSEWIVFFYVFLVVSLFNLMYLSNMLFVDMPWEERMTLSSSLSKSILMVVGVGIICFCYIHFLKGYSLYKTIRKLIWGILFVLNVLFCMLWFGMSYSFDLSNGERIILLSAIVVSGGLAFKVIREFRK